MKKSILTSVILSVTIILCSIIININVSANEGTGINEENDIINNKNVESTNKRKDIKIKDINESLIDIGKHNIKENDNETITINIKMVGDNLIHSPLYKAAKQEDSTYNFDFMYEHIKNDIESADLAIINQETIFINDYTKISSYPTFGSPTEVGDATVKAGFDVMAHSTNHTIDKGLQGITDTINFWKTKYPDIVYLGIHDSEDDSDIRYVNVNGINISFVNYTYGLNGLESRRTNNEYMIDMLSDNDVEETLHEASDNSDILIAILHIGNEYVYEPTQYQTKQINKFIDNGADIVICAHPHVIQPFGIVTTENGNTGLVYYSLGNFISNQNELPRILGGMADIQITKENGNTYVSNYDMIPLVTHQEVGYYTVYKLSDYTDELCKEHKLYNKGLSINYLNNLWNDIL